MVASGSLRRGLNTTDAVHKKYTEVVSPHIDSFDSFVRTDIRKVIDSIEPVQIHLKDREDTWTVSLSNPHIAKPVLEGETKRPCLPRHCREMGSTYKGKLTVHLRVCNTSTGAQVNLVRSLGSMPIMLQSSLCHLRGKSKPALVRMKEEPDEFGGTFICNGIERVLRLLVQQRRHYIMALRRSAYRNRGSNYTEFATLIRCVRPDQSSATVRLHYLADGNVNFAFTINRAEYFIPVALLLKGLSEVTDKELFDVICSGAPTEEGSGGSGHSSFVADRAEVALRTCNAYGYSSRVEVLSYLGEHFRIVLPYIQDYETDEEVGEKVLKNFVFVHLESADSKFNLLMQMLHKLYALVNFQCCDDNPDALSHHEILLPGQLLAKYFKEKVEDSLSEFVQQVQRDISRAPSTVQLTENYVRHAAERISDFGRKFEYLLNTGNLASHSGLDLSQMAGFTVIAEKLNFHRYLAHFRAVHRGAYFMEIRTTTVRKLRPEAFGFMCPVHTPDGAPCGLLNHFASTCNVVCHPVSADDVQVLKNLIVSYGVLPVELKAPLRLPEYIPVQIDGQLVGFVASARAPALVQRLREVKAAALESSRAGLVGSISRQPGVPFHLEICYMQYERGGPHAGLFLFTEQARMARPVRQVKSQKTEMVGSLEQSTMHIRCPDGGVGGSPGLNFTHEELGTSSMLSNIANFTPFSDFNQSPRNMYQCQMGKQTMGTPTTAYNHRTDTKLYRLHTPQKPMARTKEYDELCMDEYPQGTNMVVAVCAYTGYDMEDAMILNKSSVDRGLAHGSLLKTEVVNLAAYKGKKLAFGPAAQSEAAHAKEVAQLREKPPTDAFDACLPQNKRPEAGSKLSADGCHKDSDRVDEDGLPKVGVAVWPGQTFCSMLDQSKNNRPQGNYLKGEEAAVVQQVSKIGEVLSGKKVTGACQRANITLRLNRNPVIGDKFASRAGQKGVLGQLWPDEDMPFVSSTGMRPDLLINPHAFPSRMTIGMLLESMASKAGALHGEFVDASSFQKCDHPEDDEYAHKPVEYTAKRLQEHGYSRHGQEMMINGFTGEEMPCEIFVGLVYYQRLRHMVKDKFQVRAVGKNNRLTRQPIKGRKFGGGIRFGEMERDSLLAHGAAYLLHDRLHYCSDYHVLDVCKTCGSIISLLHKPSPSERVFSGLGSVAVGRQASKAATCLICKDEGRPERISIPYVLKYLVAELAVMSIKVKLDVKQDHR